MKQRFQNKIVNKATGPKMFLDYKKDRRNVLETSVMQSDEHLQAENE